MSGDSAAIEVSYFGQKSPGLIPMLFAPGVISLEGRYEHGLSFSPDFDELYFTANKEDEAASVYFSIREDGGWTIPAKANFTKGEKLNEMHAFVNPSNTKIYFTAYDSIFADERIWYVNRLDNSWSEAKILDSKINDDLVFYSNQSKNGDIFYTNLSKRKMYYAPHQDGEYPAVDEVDIEFGFHGFVSPQQDYLVVNARNKEDDARSDNDIYVYFKNMDGKWSAPIHLSDAVNSTFDETCPSITPDGKYLFFGRYNEKDELSNFYWVSTEVIQRLRPQEATQ